MRRGSDGRTPRLNSMQAPASAIHAQKSVRIREPAELTDDDEALDEWAEAFTFNVMRDMSGVRARGLAAARFYDQYSGHGDPGRRRVAAHEVFEHECMKGCSLSDRRTDVPAPSESNDIDTRDGSPPPWHQCLALEFHDRRPWYTFEERPDIKRMVQEALQRLERAGIPLPLCLHCGLRNHTWKWCVLGSRSKCSQCHVGGHSSRRCPLGELAERAVQMLEGLGEPVFRLGAQR